MKLVVAEKPSVAQSLAAVLGAKVKKDGYLEGGGWLVSWCVGHLVELAQPEAYGEQYVKWRYADLPIPSRKPMGSSTPNGGMRIFLFYPPIGNMMWQGIRKSSLASCAV